MTSNDLEPSRSIRQFPPRHASRQGLASTGTATGSQIGAGLPLLPWIFLSPPTQVPTWTVALSLLALGVVCTGIAYALFYRLIRDAGSDRAVTVTFIVPVFAQVWGALFIGEPITWASSIGCGLVLLAVALIFERVPGFGRTALPVAVPVLAKPAGRHDAAVIVVSSGLARGRSTS